MTSTPPAKTPARKTATPARKTPTDRQPKKSEQLRSSPPVGHETLRDVTTLRSGEIAEAQASIVELFGDIGIDLDNPDGEVEVETSPEVLRAFGKLGALMETYAVDVETFIKDVDTGPGSQQRVSELAMWFLGRLGESNGSAS